MGADIIILTGMRKMTNKILMFGLMLSLSVFIVNFTIGTNPIKAETGKGTDISKLS